MHPRLHQRAGTSAAVAAAAFLSLLSSAPGAEIPRADSSAADAVIRQMLAMDRWRLLALQRYTSRRRYVAENKRFGKRAEVEVREEYSFPGIKRLEILKESGSSFIRRRVIDKLIEAEAESVLDENRDQTKTTPANYEFKLLGEEEQEGRSCFVISIEPKAPKKYLIKGRIWVDKQDYAIVRMEGKPAKKPSFWTRKVRIVRRYKKHGPFWLAASLESVSNIFIAGKSTLLIEYFDYKVNPVERRAVASRRALDKAADGAPDQADVAREPPRRSAPPSGSAALGFRQAETLP